MNHHSQHHTPPGKKPPTAQADDTSSALMWNLHVKQVAGAPIHVEMSPEDCVQNLIHKVAVDAANEALEQGRLIYRGRLLDPSTLLKDVTGLEDGQTLHFCPPSKQQESDEDTSPSPVTGEPTQTENETPRRRTRPPHRLTPQDIVPADPGSMESVRQGMMTIHTMTEHGRRFYRGQWLDARDTVNAWLEATVVDVVDPDELVGPTIRNTVLSTDNLTAPVVEEDPVVHAGDLEGRMRLLLQPCEAGHHDELPGDWRGYRPRDDNCQLLLIHYNGWPHRWDEWIRSDSERLRPFRSRTRSSGPVPTIHSPYASAPPTYIRCDDDEVDRQSLLPELLRVMTTVQERIQLAAEHLPVPPSTPREAEVDDGFLPWNTDNDGDSSDESVYLDSEQENHMTASTRRQLEALAPLMDRLGRLLIDAAPHVASLAVSPGPPVDPAEEEPTRPLSPRSLGGLLSLLGRDRRQSTSSSTDAVLRGESTVSEQTQVTEESASPRDPDMVDFSGSIVNTTRGEVRTGPRGRRAPTDDISSLLGAYLAAASLVGGSDSEGLGSLLRLLRGEAGPGIDIHIHAVVSSPDGNDSLPSTGEVGLASNAAVPPGNLPAPAGEDVARLVGRNERMRGISRRSFSRLRAPLSPTQSVPSHGEEDSDLFSELYSENPDSANPSDAPSPHANPHAARSSSGSESHPTPSRSRIFRPSRSRGSERSDSTSGTRRSSTLRRFFRRGQS